MRTLGLTGGIGSGKSTVAALLAARGATVIDADALSRAATAPGGTAMPAIAAQFGHTFVRPDGALDRERMRALVFADGNARHRLEAIVHPLVRAETEALTRQAAAAGRRWVVHDVPLLVESQGWTARVDRVLVVDCREATQVARVQARSGLDAPAVWRVIRAQAPRAVRRAAADMVLCNDGISLDGLAREVAMLAEALRL